MADALLPLLAAAPCLLLALLLGVVVWSVVHAQRVHRQRVAAFHAWARANGWSYHESEPPLANRFQGEPFGQGSGRQALHVMRGTHRGRHLVAFEYQYTVSHGRSSTTHRNTIVAIPIPTQRPYLQVSTEHAGHKLLELFGVRDLQLESEEFNRAFRIKTGSDRFAYDVLHPRMMQWMLADQRARIVPFRFEGSDLLCWSGSELDPRRVIWMADFLVDVAKRVPGYVWT